jgi:hypothetical protein
MINLFTIFFVILLLFGAAAVDDNSESSGVFESPKRAEMEKYAGPRLQAGWMHTTTVSRS